MRLHGLAIDGYKALRSFKAPLGPLEVFVGANGTGKTSLFEFLRFLRDGMTQEVPPEIIPGSLGQQIFHRPGSDEFSWELEIGEGETFFPEVYEGTLLGPIGQPKLVAEAWNRKPWEQHPLRKPRQFSLSLATPSLEVYKVREFIDGWRFYSSFKINSEKVRQSVFVEQEPVLQEDAGNLSAVLHYLYTEYPLVFDDLQQHLRSVVPGFRSLSVKARGGPGQVLAFWYEEGAGELTLADLSDGILRLLCWIVLCIHPKPPGLICIDEPDQGVHPRTLPLLAGLFEKAADRTQILLATHASYFLLQFGIERIAVLRKEDGEVKFFKPKDSEALTRNLEDFGPQEIEVMHRSDELEQLA